MTAYDYLSQVTKLLQPCKNRFSHLFSYLHKSQLALSCVRFYSSNASLNINQSCLTSIHVWHDVPKADGCQRDKAEVRCINYRPFLPRAEYGCAEKYVRHHGEERKQHWHFLDLRGGGLSASGR